MRSVREICASLAAGEYVSDDDIKTLLLCRDEDAELLFRSAAKTCEEVYGREIYVRGLIEISSYCKNDCYYCGIRRSNRCAERYRLTPDEIIECAGLGYSLGFRTFVLQGGEDSYYTDDILVPLVSQIKEKYPQCAVTLSLGERSPDSYKRLRLAGADRYLLRHETASEEHYAMLHPADMSYANRMNCLKVLKALGYQTGCGFMVGSPYQTIDNIVKDIRFIQNFKPHMVGIGPYITHKDTPFCDRESGSVELTLRCLAVVRLIHRTVLLPATTALGTMETGGRERGILAGANVIMPNLSPESVRKKYMLYDNKLSSGAESAWGLRELEESLGRIGYKVSYSRGDSAEI